MISHRHRCIYVKIPKCAGTSVLDWFVAHGRGRHSFRPWWYGGLLSERIQGVARAMNLYPDYFTFTFVRNPYERFVSAWRYVNRQARVRAARHPEHPADYGGLGEFAELCQDLLPDFEAVWGADARAFFRANAERRYGPRGIPLKHLGLVADHARRQADFLPDLHPERLFGVRRAKGDPLSFIGTVEEIDADFDSLRNILGLPADPLPARNRSGTPDASGGAARYAACYDRATRRIVEELYAADLAFTGCRFRTGAAAVPSSAPRTGRPDAAGRLRTPAALPARLWFRVRAAEIGAEARMGRSRALKRLLWPLVRLRRRRARRGRQDATDRWWRPLPRPGTRRWDQLLAAFITRWAPGSSRDRFILVTGFHHTGTTLVQALLRQQGVFTFANEPRDGHGDRPRELPLRHIHKIERAARGAGRARAMTKLPTNTAQEATWAAFELRLLAPRATVVVCRRDPAATALSLAKRFGWDPGRALADARAQRDVLEVWRSAARRHGGPVHFLALESFTRDPERCLRRILRLGGEPMPAPVETAGTDAAGPIEATLPDPRRHEARRRAQSHLPVYPVERDAWMATETGEILTVLRRIRRRFGTTPD